MMLVEALRKYKDSFSSYTLIATILLFCNIILMAVIIYNLLVSGANEIYKIFPNADVRQNLVRTLTTVAATLAGFSYTTLGVMVSFLSNKDVQNDQSDGYLDKYFLSAYSSLVLFAVAIIVGLASIIMETMSVGVWISFGLLVLVINGVIMFVFTLWQFIYLVQYIRMISQK